MGETNGSSNGGGTDVAALAAEDRAWDPIRPPEMDLIEDCVHCGFCLPTCPTYVLWGEEMDSPRGRIVLMRSGHEQGSELSDEMVLHLDNCLGCMACVTACPSGVQYNKLIEDTRAQIERNHPHRPTERVFRRLLFETFPHPERLRLMAPLLFTYRNLGLDRMVKRSGLLGRLPRLAGLEALSPSVPVRRALRRMPEELPATGTRRGRIGFLQGCVQRVFFGDVNDATVRVLTAEGYDVHAPNRPGCCGALELHAGADEPARARAKETITAFEDVPIVAVNAAGCGSAMKDYGHLFRDDPEWAERAAAFAAKVRDVSEVLAAEEPQATRHPLPMKVAYHDACHLAHAQGVRAEPRKVLKAIPELELLEPAEWEICCGSAGIYNLMKPEPAAQLGRRKAENLLATGAEAITAANPGCTLQISSHLEQMGEPRPTYHPMELLAMSLDGRQPKKGKVRAGAMQ